MKYLSVYLISAILFCTVGCKNQPVVSTQQDNAKWRNDTILNSTFNYMPDTCIIDKDLYTFAANLIDISRIYTDSTTYIECYKKWFDNTSSQVYCDLYIDRDIEIDSCICFIRNNLIPEIRRNGTNCTASIAETVWLEFGINLYLAFYEFELTVLEADANLCMWWLDENDAWLNFITNVFPLIEYEICDRTGSSAAYEIPYIFSKISRFRTQCLTEFPLTPYSKNKITTPLNNLLSQIEGIDPVKIDWEQNRMVENVAIMEHKKCAVESLLSWIEVRKGMAELVDNRDGFNNATANLIDSIYTKIINRICNGAAYLQNPTSDLVICPYK